MSYQVDVLQVYSSLSTLRNFLFRFTVQLQREKKKKLPWARHVSFCLPYQAYISRKHQDDKVFVFERGSVTFVFNFHTSKSFVDYKIGIQVPGKYPSYNAIVLRWWEDWILLHQTLVIKIDFEQKFRNNICWHVWIITLYILSHKICIRSLFKLYNQSIIFIGETHVLSYQRYKDTVIRLYIIHIHTQGT